MRRESMVNLVNWVGMTVMVDRLGLQEIRRRHAASWGRKNGEKARAWGSSPLPLIVEEEIPIID